MNELAVVSPKMERMLLHLVLLMPTYSSEMALVVVMATGIAVAVAVVAAMAMN